MSVLTLRQTFPLGRFHATPWKVFPYDDPHGEWPPSPWRLLRALVARWHQWRREDGEATGDSLEPLMRIFCASELAWHLPPFTWRGPGVRQYQPAEFQWLPAAAKEPGMKCYKTTKTQDNSWLLARPNDPTNGTDDDATALWWMFDGSEWDGRTLATLDACLARLTYFGRAESITAIHRVPAGLPAGLTINCRLRATRTAGAVPVLAPRPDATLEQIGVTTDRPEVADRPAPPGARWLFAERPIRPPAREERRHRSPATMPPPVQLIQFALGARVLPPMKDTVVLTNRFRGRAVRALLEAESGGRTGDWRKASDEWREAVAGLNGKDARGEPLDGHRHARFLLHYETEGSGDGRPTRLLVWRNTPFREDERQALLQAAVADLPLAYKDDPWSVRLVPLDRAVPPPPGFDGVAHRVWTAATPYVPPRHVHDARGREKPGESVTEQIRRDLTEALGVDVAETAVVTVGEARWVKAHQPRGVRGAAGATNADKRGYHVGVEFAHSVTGPLMLGHSSHFGLGLFIPVPEGIT